MTHSADQSGDQSGDESSHGLDYTFNWHDHCDEFIGWLTTSCMGLLPQGTFETVQDRSDGFRAVTMSLSINGVQVPAQEFLQRLDDAMEPNVKHRVTRFFEDERPLNGLYDLIGDLEDLMRTEIWKRAAAAGIERPEWL